MTPYDAENRSFLSSFEVMASGMAVSSDGIDLPCFYNVVTNDLRKAERNS